MERSFKEMVWHQCGAAIDMLENAITACPPELWGNRTVKPEFWYVAFHTIFFIDCYMSETGMGFVPPAPFTLDELDPAGIMPERVYTKDELLRYLEYSRKKCRDRIAAMTVQQAESRCDFEWLDISAGEMVFYTMRHIQHHAGQLNTLLRQHVDAAPRWVRQTPGALID